MLLYTSNAKQMALNGVLLTPKEADFEQISSRAVRTSPATEDFTHLSRRDLIDLCAAMQQNLRTAKSACSEQKSAAKALRKELQHERATSMKLQLHF